MGDYIVKKTITINAPAAAVWDALTDPEKTKEYFFHCRVLSDWKQGSPIIFKGHIFWIIPIAMRGVINKVTPCKLLQYTLSNGKGGESTSTVTDELIEVGGKTTLHITDEVGQGEGAEKRYHKSVRGWDKILKGLKELLGDK